MKNLGWIYLASLLISCVSLGTISIYFTTGSVIENWFAILPNTAAILDIVARASSIGLMVEGLAILLFSFFSLAFKTCSPATNKTSLTPGTKTNAINRRTCNA